MRQVATGQRIELLLNRLGEISRTEARVYLTGGATAVLHGWRETTVDVDLKLIPDSDDLLRGLVRLKEELDINVELAAPDQFIPELPGWLERSLFIERVRQVDFFHYDLYSQALSKLERGHVKDLADVTAMAIRGFIEPDALGRLFDAIQPELFRYPAIDPATFRSAVDAMLREWPEASS